MLYEATVSFCGKLTMQKGEKRELTDKAVIDNLIKAGYIKAVKPAKERKSDKNA